MTYNINQIMTQAHEMTRAAIQTGDSYAATLSAALRVAWSRAKEPSARAAWDSMSGEEKYSAQLRMVWYAKRRDCGTDRDGNPRPMVMDWIETADDAAAVAAAAYIRLESGLLDRLNDAGRPLPWIMCRAAYLSARAIDRAERRNARAIKTAEGPDGQPLDVIDIYAGPQADRIAPSPEEAAIALDSLRRACRDSVDRRIVSLAARGYTVREIASVAGIGISYTQVSRRLQSIRSRYNEQ